jgi:hypothetical protein
MPRGCYLRSASSPEHRKSHSTARLKNRETNWFFVYTIAMDFWILELSGASISESKTGVRLYMAHFKTSKKAFGLQGIKWIELINFKLKETSEAARKEGDGNYMEMLAVVELWRLRSLRPSQTKDFLCSGSLLVRFRFYFLS